MGDLDLNSAIHFTVGIAQVPGALLGVELRQVESKGVVFKMHTKSMGIIVFILKQMLGENLISRNQK